MVFFYKKLYIIILFFLLSFTAIADEFIVLSFKAKPESVAAREKQMTDVNDRKCALIIIYTDVDLSNAMFDANPMVCGSQKAAPGEWWLYVSPNSSKIQIKKEGFIPLNYPIPNGITLESMNTFEMRITNKEKNLMPEKEKQPEYVVIKSEPTGAKVYLNKEYKGLTPYSAIVLEGDYGWKLEKEKYYTEEGNFTVVVGSPPSINKTLRPQFGKLTIESKPESGAMVLINEIETGKTTPFIDEQFASGIYTLTLRKTNYYDATQSFNVIEGKPTSLTIEMKPRFGSITIASEPETGAHIILDGVSLNQSTPYTVSKLSSGKHKAEVQKDLYEPTSQQFTVIEGQTTTLTLPMKAVYGEVSITTNPLADIYIDSKKEGSGAITNKRLVSGTHFIEAKKDKHTNATKTIDVKIETKESYTLEPKPKTGTLSVNTTPIEAELYVDDILKGKTPMFVRNLLIGEYTVQLKMTGYDPVNKKVTIEDNKTTEVNETLPQGEQETINTSPKVEKIKNNGGTEQSMPYTKDPAFGATVNIFSQDGEKFWIILNGIKQNETPTTNVKVTGLSSPNYRLKIIFNDEKIASINKDIMTKNYDDVLCDQVYVIKKDKRGEYVMRLNSFEPAKLIATTVEPNQIAVPFSTVDKEVVKPIETKPVQQTKSTQVQPTQSAYKLPGYDGPQGCELPMSTQDFNDAKKSISSKSFEDSKLLFAKQVTAANCLLTTQVKDLMMLFSFEETKLQFAKYAYQYTFDLGNFYKVNDAFTFEMSINELNEFISSKKK